MFNKKTNRCKRIINNKLTEFVSCLKLNLSAMRNNVSKYIK